MKLGRVLMVVKQTALTRLSRERSKGAARMRKLLAERDTSVDRIEPAHEQHMRSVERVRQALRSRGVEITERRVPPERPVRGYDLVVSVGGDGTLLGVSHAVRDATPVLGVNSSPAFSVGHLTGATADTFDETLDALRAGRLTPVAAQRLRVRVGNRTIAGPVLNDVLFCADNPAVMTRYNLRWPFGCELQRSSGVWISTPAGSTSAIASAGGPTLPLTAEQFAFLVREPYIAPGSSVRLRVAVLDATHTLSLECRIEQASVFLDGSHRRYPVPFGETVRLTLHPQPLRLVTVLPVLPG